MNNTSIATPYDVSPYEQGGAWHVHILRIFEGRVGPATAIYDSRADNRSGYKTRDEALAAGRAKKETLLVN